LLLIVKESLHNILKHGSAREVFIGLTVTESALELRIEDDGRGFEPGRQARLGNGLENMRKRATDLGGEFGLHSAPGKGTQIKVHLPLDLSRAR
jgi:signal transduction histidine kinase